MNYSQGDIVLVHVPYSDLSEFKKRSVVIVSNANSVSFNNHLVAKITSKLKNDNLSFPINQGDITDNLKKQSEVRTNEVFTLSESKVEKRISAFHQNPLERLLEKVRGHFTP